MNHRLQPSISTIDLERILLEEATSAASITPTTGWDNLPSHHRWDKRPNYAKGLHRDKGELLQTHPRLRILQMTDSVLPGTRQAVLFADPQAVNFQMLLVRDIQHLGLRITMCRGGDGSDSFDKVMEWNTLDAEPPVYAYKGKV